MKSIILFMLLAIQTPSSTVEMVPATVEIVESIRVDDTILSTQIVETKEKNVVKLTTDTDDVIVEAHFSATPFPPIRMQPSGNNEYYADLKKGVWFIHVFNGDVSEWLTVTVENGGTEPDPPDPDPPPIDDDFEDVPDLISAVVPDDAVTASRLVPIYANADGETAIDAYVDAINKATLVFQSREDRRADWHEFNNLVRELSEDREVSTVKKMKDLLDAVSQGLEASQLHQNLPMDGPTAVHSEPFYYQQPAQPLPHYQIIPERIQPKFQKMLIIPATQGNT